MTQTAVSGIHYYPIKSCAGTALTEAVLTSRGIQHDREFMLVDLDGYFLTQREHPRMALIQPTVTDAHLTLQAPSMTKLTIPIIKEGLTYKSVVWRSQCDVVDQGEEVAAWLNRYLQTPCRLVRMAEGFVRTVNPAFAKRPLDQVSFADGYPVLLISEASLADLNGRLVQPLPMNRFRPNIVVSGCEPFAEDSWQQIRVGSTTFDIVKPCARCTVTTVNQATGEKEPKEPLATLARYRQQAGGVMFGQNLLQQNNGRFQIGDLVEIIR
ncbi:MAG: MOSC N-terminal beta barrel domain-containing protein [Chloroflexota bacterium]